MRRVLEYAQITLGTAIAALAVPLFMMPFQTMAGGLGGLLLVLHYLWNVPVGIGYFALNLPAMLWLFKLHGWNALIKTIWGATSFSIFLQLFQPLAAFPPTQNMLLATLYGAVLTGLGNGLALRVGGSTGGTTCMGQVVRHYTGLDVSKFLYASDFVIILFAGVMLRPEMVLYGLLVSFLAIRVIQAVLDGFSTSRCFLVISERPEELTRALLTVVRRGVTRLQATGGYSGQERPVLICVVAEKEVLRTKLLIQETDPSAFMVITDAREVAGRGFTLETPIHPIPFWEAQRGA